MTEAYVSIKYILDKVTQHPLMQDISLEQAIDMTISFMRIVGVPRMFKEKVEEIKIEKYRGILPCDYYQIIQIRNSDGTILNQSTDNFYTGGKDSNFSYKIQGNIIYTSIESGTLEMSYLSIPTDDDGYPLLPDNSSFTRALELYIKKQWFTILFDLGKVPLNALQNTQREYAWAVGDCQTEFNRLSIDQMEALSNSWRTLIFKDRHTVGFKYN